METPRGQAHQPEREPTRAKVVLGVVLLVVIVAMAVDNRRSTRIGYVFGHGEAPLFVVLLVAAIVGALVGWLLLHLPRRRRHQIPHEKTGAPDGRQG